MSSPESAKAIYSDAVDRLRSSDRIIPVERLRRDTFGLLEAIPGARTTEEVEAALPTLRLSVERPLAVALALLDFGGKRGEREVGWAVRTIATDLGRREAESTEPLTALSLYDFAFSLVADCFSRGDLRALPALGGAVIPGRFERRNWPVFQASGVRHPNAFQRDADSAYRSWSDWLSASELVESLAHVRDREAYLSACAAAELVAALSFARAHGDSTFCAVVGREEIGEGSPAEQMLRGCLRIDGAVESLSGFFDVQPDELTEELNRLYPLLTGGGHFGQARGLLVPTEI
jgi:hypothetical protein